MHSQHVFFKVIECPPPPTKITNVKKNLFKPILLNLERLASGKLRTIIAKMSAARTGKTSKENITLDTGAMCSIVILQG